MFEKLDPIIAAFNDGANRGFWRIQLRDTEGRWAEMGRGLLSKVRMPDGSIQDQRGVYIGASERNGYGRQLVLEDDGKYYIYDIKPSNLTQFDATIPDEVLKKQGISKKARTPSLAEQNDPDIQDLADMNRRPATDFDVKLATDTPDEGQKAIIKAEREKSPLAKLPAGAEGKLSDKELKDLIESPADEKSKEKDRRAFDPSKIAKSKNKSKDLFKFKSPKEFFEEERRIQSADPKDLSDEELKERIKFDMVLAPMYKNAGRVFIPNSVREAESRGLEIPSGPPSLYFDVAVENAVKKIDSGEKVDLNDVIKSVNSKDSVMNEGLDDVNLADIVFFDEDTTVETPETKKPPVKKERKPRKKVNVKVDLDSVSDPAMPAGIPDAKRSTPEELNKKTRVRPAKTDFSLEELDAMGDPKDYIEDFGGFTPSQEQTRIVNAIVKADLNVAVEALAGSGKTTTIIATANALARVRPDEGVLIVAFNTNTASEAQKRAPKQNTRGRTSHSLAYENLNKIQKDIVSNANRGYVISDASNAEGTKSTKPGVVQHLGIEDTLVDGENFTPTQVVDIVERAIKDFSNSEDREIGQQHFSFLEPEDEDEKKNYKFNPKLLEYANKYWDDISSDLVPKYDKDGLLNKKYDEIGKYLDIKPTSINGVKLTPGEVAKILDKATLNFSDSGDKNLEEKHFAPYISNIGDPSKKQKFNPELLNYGNKYNEEKSKFDELGFLIKGYDKYRLRVTQDHSLKLWSLSDPDFSNLRINGKNVGVVFFDEAQDTNPAVASVIRNNLDKVQVAYVGDPNQSIYGWRGAVNAIEDAKESVDATLDLTVTRRFGEGLTSTPNAFLNLIGANRRVKGLGSGGEVVSEEDMPFGEDRAHLVRSNAKGVEYILDQISQGNTVGALSVFYKDLRDAVYNLKWLDSPFKTVDSDGNTVKRSKTPLDNNGRPSWSDDFFGMTKIADLYKKAREEPGSKAGKWLALLEKVNKDGVAEKDSLTTRLEEMLDKLVVETSDQVALGGEFTGEKGSNGILWSSRSGDSIDYEIEEDGSIYLSGPGIYEFVRGDNIGQTLKIMGFKYMSRARGYEPGYKIPAFDNEERKSMVKELVALLPKMSEYEKRPADVIVSTAHRSKGLEWNHVSIGEDFLAPEPNLKTGELELPSAEELRLSYVATSRAKKSLSLGSLEWATEYEGRTGLVKANNLVKRPDNFGADAWDYYDKQSAEEKKKRPKKLDSEELFSSLDNMDYSNFIFYDEDTYISEENEREEEEEDTDLELSAPPSFLDGWAQTQGGDYSKSVDGFRWSIKENKDGTVTIRPRTDPSLGTTKYENMQKAIKAFPGLVQSGSESNRKKLKDIVAPFDSTGEIQKAIDNGESADDINALIQTSDDWVQAIDDGTANFLALRAGLERVANRSVNISNPKTAKPKVISKKKATPPTPISAPPPPTPPPGGAGGPPPPPKNSDFWINNPARRDTGGDVGRFISTEEDIKRYKGAKTTDQIKLSLLDINPDSMIKPNGAVVVYRGTHVEEYGPAEGESRELEVSVMDNRDSSLSAIIRITNPVTGETKEYIHYKPHHSFKSVVGAADTESAGVQRLLANFFRDPIADPFTSKRSKAAQLRKRFGGIEGFIVKSRSANLQKILSDPSETDTNWKLRTPEEHARIALSGRSRILNMSLKNWWTQSRKERPSIFNALEDNDTEFAQGILITYINSIPDTDENRKIVESYLTDSIKKKFPKVKASQLSSLLSVSLSSVKSQLPRTGQANIPHMTSDGIYVQPGDYVQWTSNVPGESPVIGRVEYLQRSENPDDGNYTYSDVAQVSFRPKNPNKKELPKRLNTKNMKFFASAADVEKDPKIKDSLTEYTGWLKRDLLKISTAEEAGFTVNMKDGTIRDADNNVVDVLDSFRSRSNLLTRRDISEGPKTSSSKAVTDLEAGETLMNTETGDAIGVVKEIKSGTLPDGRKITVVFLEDGSDKKYLSSDQVTVESDAVEADTTPEKVAPVDKTPKGDAAREAAALGLGTPPDQKPKKVISKNKSKDETAMVQIKGEADRKAIKPTDEAREAKDTLVASGAKAWETAKSRIAEKLKAAGYDVSASDYQEVVKEDANNYSKLVKARDKAMIAVNKYEEKFGTDSTAKRQQLEKAAIDAAIKVEEAQEKSEKLISEFGVAERNATKEVLEEMGVRFDNVSVDEFNGRILTDEARLPVGPNDQYDSAVALREALDFMPANMIRALINKLESEDSKLFIKSGVKRGHFKKRSSKEYEIHLSTSRRGETTPDLNKATDTMLHELMHFSQIADTNLNALEHAWTYDRVVTNRGTEEESLPNIMSLDVAGREKTFAAPGIAQPYMLKQYTKGKNTFLDPNHGHSEVFTVLMQDLFTAPGFASRGSGLNAITKDPETKKKSVISNVYYDPETGMYYEDSAMSNPIENVVGSFGRNPDDGTDEDVKSFGMGMLLALSDWDPLTGFDPNDSE